MAMSSFKSIKKRRKLFLIFTRGPCVILLLLYSRFCYYSDTFHVPGRRHVHDYNLHGIPCKIMVFAMLGFALVLTLTILEDFVSLKLKVRLARLHWPLIYTFAAVSIFALIYDYIFN